MYHLRVTKVGRFKCCWIELRMSWLLHNSVTPWKRLLLDGSYLGDRHVSFYLLALCGVLIAVWFLRRGFIFRKLNFPGLTQFTAWRSRRLRDLAVLLLRRLQVRDLHAVWLIWLLYVLVLRQLWSNLATNLTDDLTTYLHNEFLPWIWSLHCGFAAVDEFRLFLEGVE